MSIRSADLLALLAPVFAQHGRISSADVQRASDALDVVTAFEDARLDALENPSGEPGTVVEGRPHVIPDAFELGRRAYAPPTHQPPAVTDDHGPRTHNLPSPQASFGGTVPVTSPVAAK